MSPDSGAGPSGDDGPEGPDWAPAIAYAVVGRVPPGLSVQGKPDVAAVIADLERSSAAGADGVAAEIAAARRTARWPHRVSDELTARLGPAQWLAVQRELTRRYPARTARSVSERPLDADERRLAADRPPHHGT